MNIYGRKDAGAPETPEAIGHELKRITDEVKTFAEKAQGEIKRAGELSVETKANVDQLLLRQSEISTRLQDVEQKLASSRAGPEIEEPETIGSALQKAAESDPMVKALLSGKKPHQGQVATIDVSRKALLAGGSGSGDALTYPMDVRPLVTPLLRRLTVRDLLMPGSTQSSAIFYPRETGFTNAAAIQSSEGAEKAESSITFDDITAPVVTIAHWLDVSTQMLSDVAYLTSYLNGRMMYGLKYKEENQLLNGSGVGNNLEGIYTAATAYSEPSGVAISEEQFLDRLRLMILQAELAEAMVSGIVLHPTDWANIELLKDSQQRYLFTNPQGTTTGRLWGRDVVATQAIAQDDALVGDFAAHAQILDREDAAIAISFENKDNFTRNVATIRVEERLVVAIYRPEAFIKGSLSST